MAEAIVSDTALAAGKTYAAGTYPRSLPHRALLVVLAIHTSATAGNRQVQLVMRVAGVAVGHGVVLADTGVKANTGTIVYAEGGPTNGQPIGGNDNVTTWNSDVVLSSLVALDVVANLQAGDTVDVFILSQELEQDQVA